ncbi:hypothetical protein GEMRC1_008381 [Eukaryota sp. GEM-RC1]
MFLVCSFSLISFAMLSTCCDRTGRFSYKGVAKKIFGNKFGVVVEVLVLLYTASLSISYVVLLGDFLPNISHYVFPDTWHPYFFDRTYLIIGLSILILLPLSCLPKLDALRFTSAAAIACVVYLTFVVVYRFFTDSFPIPVPDTRGPIVYFNWSHTMFLAIPLMAVSFTAHYNVPDLYKELDKRSPGKFSKAALITCTFCFFLYVMVSVSGYLSFRGNTSGDILNNYDHNDVLAIIARVGLTLTLSFSFPLVCFSIRSSIEAITLDEPEPNWIRQVILATVITVVSVTIAILEERIEVVLSLGGSSVGLMIGFTFPALFYVKVGILPGEKFAGLKKFAGVFICVMGVVLTGFCTWVSARQL